MRRKIFEIVEQSKDEDRWSLAYDIFMLIAITVSIIPLMFVEDNTAFVLIEQVTVTFFIIDYLLRWLTADMRLGKKGWAIIDFLSILPAFNILGKGFPDSCSPSATL